MAVTQLDVSRLETLRETFSSLILDGDVKPHESHRAQFDAAAKLLNLLSDRDNARAFVYQPDFQSCANALLKSSRRQLSDREDWRAVYLRRRCVELLVDNDMSLKFRVKGVLDESDSLARIAKPFAEPGVGADILSPDDYWPPRGHATGLGGRDRETLIVFPGCPYTAAAVREAAAYARAKPWLGAHGAVERLANWVFNRMGGVVADPDAITSHMDGLAAGHEACVLVTQIEIGTCRQRALLFKLMFDHLAELREPLLEGVKCRLIRAAVGAPTEGDTAPLWHSWPMVLIPEHDALRATHFVVDCMRSSNTRLFLEGCDEMAPFTGQGRARPCRGSMPLADRRFHVESMRGVHVGDLLGAGGFSKVFKVSLNGELFAVKRVPRKIIEKVGVAAVTNEASLLAAIDHPNVMRLHSSFFEESDFFMFLELGDTTFAEFFQREQRDRAQRHRDLLRYALEFASGMECLHQVHLIVHSDLKPENILRTAFGSALICDLGVGKCFVGFRSNLIPVTGTGTYMAPEMKGDTRSTKLMGRSGRPRDVWSYGVCILEALIAPDARVFHLCASESNGYIPASRKDLDAAAALEPIIGKLVLDCLAVQPERRPTFVHIRRTLEEELLRTGFEPAC